MKSNSWHVPRDTKIKPIQAFWTQWCNPKQGFRNLTLLRREFKETRRLHTQKPELSLSLPCEKDLLWRKKETGYLIHTLYINPLIAFLHLICRALSWIVPLIPIQIYIYWYHPKKKWRTAPSRKHFLFLFYYYRQPCFCEINGAEAGLECDMKYSKSGWHTNNLLSHSYVDLCREAA